ncbi:squalene epoxidase 3 [Nicotiana tabacum]|uniref:squalene monooxygenase n=2 Tax=Nicotiana TaxID=4085 RepID=A0A1S4CPM1_TOBAC|nr:PREDICTED: squalene epoxidase 3-like [Nicotiana sylvestris]XP_016502919.1 PREDICTED: squalene epoxidase 3-like [Nicotiana tabacum]
MLLINIPNNPPFSLVFSKHNFRVSTNQTPPQLSQPSASSKKKKLALISFSKYLRNTQLQFISTNEKMVNFMMDKYIVPTFFVSLLGFLLLYILRPRLRTGPYYKKKDPKTSQKCDTQNVISSNLTNGECKLEKGSDADIIIVGAGVAGAALAHTLAKEGRRVLVIERDLTEPDRIVGELLQPGGYLKLIELGLEDCVEDIDAQRVVGYALFKDGKSTNVSYPLENFHSDVAGRSFHNGRFIQKMREKAATFPNVRLEQGTVTSLIEENGSVKGIQYKTKAGQELKAHAPLTVVCDGCFSNLRRSLCNPKVDIPSCFVGLVLELENNQLPYPNHGHVILADPSPILFYPISSTEIRCLVDVPGQKLPSLANGDMANYLKTMVAPQVPPELHDAFITAIDKGHIRTMPNRSMPAAPYPTPGALLLGDSFNMRHPLTGGGMTVALSDIAVLRNLLKPLNDLNDADELCKYLESFYTLRKPVASTINTLAGALYKVFCASPDQARKEMREACFDYLSLGGTCSTGPVALLSGLNPSPLSLVLHFFAVAIYGVGRLLVPFPSPKRLWIGARLISAASSIIFPIIKAEGVRQMFFPTTIPAYHRAPPVNKGSDQIKQNK